MHPHAPGASAHASYICRGSLESGPELEQPFPSFLDSSPLPHPSCSYLEQNNGECKH